METNNPNRTWEFSRNILRCIANYPSPREVLRLVTNKEAALLIFSKQFLDWLRAVCVMSQSLARKLLLFANQIIRRRVSFDIIICFSVKAFWGFPALRCTFLLDSCCEVSRHFHLGTDRVANEILHTWGQYKRPSDWQQKYIGNTFKTGFCKCELLRYEKSSANWLVGFDLKMQS